MLPEVIVIEPDVHFDGRGFFLESYHQQKFEALGIRDQFVQDNHSRSLKGTLRGLHYQLHRPQAKLCRVVSGEVLDVAVDIRRGSPTFGKWASAVLSAENRRQIYVPGGFAHGFVVLSETAEFLYKCSDFYDRADERGIVWDDPDLKIEWGISAPLLSEKDKRAPRLADVSPDDLPLYVQANSAAKSRARLLSLGKHPPVLRARNSVLQNAGYEVIDAAGIEAAVSELEHSRFDVVIIGYTFSKAEKKQLSEIVSRKFRVPTLLLYIKPSDTEIPAGAHVNALHGEAALLTAIQSLLSQSASQQSAASRAGVHNAQ